MDPFETLINVQAKETVWEYLHKTQDTRSLWAPERPPGVSFN